MGVIEMGKGVPPARRWSPLGSLLAVAVGFVLAALVWVNVVGLVRERASQAQVDLYRHQTARLYSIETGPQSRSRWTARRSLVESENWDEAKEPHDWKGVVVESGRVTLLDLFAASGGEVDDEGGEW